MTTEHIHTSECSAIISTVPIEFHTATESLAFEQMEFPFWTISICWSVHSSQSYMIYAYGIIMCEWRMGESVLVYMCLRKRITYKAIEFAPLTDNQRIWKRRKRFHIRIVIIYNALSLFIIERKGKKTKCFALWRYRKRNIHIWITLHW